QRCELEQQNPAEEPVHQQDQVSTTDPDATFAPRVELRPDWDTTTISCGQSQLCDRGSASYGGAHESGNCRRARHARPFRSMARTTAGIASGRCDLRERRVLAVASFSDI